MAPRRSRRPRRGARRRGPSARPLHEVRTANNGKEVAMQVPLRVEFRHTERSEWLEQKIAEHAARLEHHADDIVSCRVTVDRPHRSKRTGDVYHVVVDIEVPGKEIVVSRDPGRLEGHVDPLIAVNEAFQAAERQLRSYHRLRHGEKKIHDPHSRGRIVEVQRDKGYGRIESNDGREVYFHRNAVVDEDFAALEVGNEVTFGEEAGEQGPQANFVKVIGGFRIST
jgi:cold shock CspA family protein